MGEVGRCRWAGSDQPRVITGRHQDECGDEGCRGCLACPMDHCRVCGVEHAQTCAGCMNETRTNLAELRRMCADLPAEVATRGVDGEAMNLLGPAADPEARGHWEASVLAGRITPPDCDARDLDDVKTWLETAAHELHPLIVIGGWGVVYRDAFEHGEPIGRVDVLTEAGYLERNLTEMGDLEFVPFEDFARDLRQCVTHMERVLHDGEQIERGAPCPACHKPLLLVYGRRVVDDRWKCENRACDVEEYTTAQYRGWVEDDALFEADKLTAADMERRFRNEDDEALVKPGEVRVWGSRELIRKRGRDDQGMTLYDVADVWSRIEARLAAAAACA